MRLPVLNVINKSKKMILDFNGLNQMPATSEGNLTYTENIVSDFLPVIVQRPPRELLQTMQAGYGLFAADGVLCHIEDVQYWTGFMYDGALKGMVAASAKSWAYLNKNVIIMPDKAYYNTETDVFGAIGTGIYPAAGSCPDMEHICECNNRLIGVNGDDIYVSALGDHTDWTTFLNPDGTVDESGAYHTDVGTDGDFTGIVNFNGIPTMFKPNCIHELLGSYPPYQVPDPVGGTGTTQPKSIVQIGKLLYYLDTSRNCISAFDGNQAYVISEKLNENYVSASAGTDGRKYCISLFNGKEYNLYVYDTWTGIWVREDDLEVCEFCNIDGQLYVLAFVEE